MATKTARSRILCLLTALLLVITLLPAGSVMTANAYGASLGDSSLGVSSVTVKLTLNGEAESSTWVQLYGRAPDEHQFTDRDWEYSDRSGNVTFRNLKTDYEYYFYVGAKAGKYLTYDGRELGLTFINNSTADPKDIQLDPGNTVTSTVYLDGSPAEGVRVSLYSQSSPYHSYYAYSDSTGKVSFSTVEAHKSYYFEVYRSTQYTRYDGSKNGNIFSVPLTGAAPDIHLDPGNIISTTVTINGKAMENVRVTLSQGDDYDWFGYYDSDYTDSDGKVSFTPAENGRYYFWIGNSDEYAEYDGREEGKIFTVPGMVPTIELKKGIDISTVVTVEGVPKSGVSVDIYRYSNVDWTDEEYITTSVSGDNGVVTFKNMPSGTRLYFRVGATDENTRYDGRSIGKIFTVSGSIPKIELSSGHAVSTTVTHNGVPQSGVTVLLWAMSKEHDGILGGTSYTAITDANGVATFSAVPTAEECYFTIDARSYHSFASYDGRRSGNVFSIPGHIPNIELEDANTVTVQLYLEGQPYYGDSSVALGYDIHSIFGKYTRSENGSVTFYNVPQGEYFVRVHRQEGVHAQYVGRLLGKTFSVTGSVTVDVDLEVGHTVSTTVTVDGEPAADVRVYLMYNNRYGSMNVLSDQNGIVTMTNAPTIDNVYFSVDTDPNRYAFYDGRAKGEFFSVPSGSYPPIQLKTGVSFSAKFTYRGEPPKGLFVDLCQLAPDGEWIYVDYVQLDQNGVANFKNILPGDNYFLSLNYGALQISYDGSNAPFSIPCDMKVIELDPDYHTGGGSGIGGGTIGGGSGGYGGSSSSSKRRVDSGTAPSFGRSSTLTGAISTTDATTLTQKALETAKAQNADRAVVRLQNAPSISLETMRAMAQTAGDTPLVIHADTLLESGGVDVRITLEPSKAVKDLLLSGCTGSARALSTKSLFESKFQNTIFVVSLAQQGEFGMPVRIAAKLSGNLNTETLLFYSYDKDTNTYQQITDPQYIIDENGYLHFSTMYGGDIIITDSPLQLK